MTLWTVARQDPLSIGFPRQEHWSGLPFPPQGDLPDPGVEPVSHVASAPQADSSPLSHWGSPISGNKKFSTTQEKAMSLCKGFYIHVFGN